MLNETAALIVGALLNLAIAFLIVRFIYYPRTREKKYVFTFLAFNTIIYFVLSLLGSSELGVGVGFGLFAIFSVLRYRTDPIPIREMTYLFIIIALPVVNSVVVASGAYWKLAVADGLTTALLYILEREWGFRYELSSRVAYDKIDLIVPERHQELLADLRERTGLAIKRVEIGRMDFIHDSAEVTVYYDAPRATGVVSHVGGRKALADDDED